ncbi:relaxase/mobilization nuclease domain-containing protein [Parasphingorhabdus sp.]|uniref:relaxase/mobilization nuclease domain-containing protein n=1 Tax=Parasphingorhabdus sp. TaxID=2709688 RepID=UPI003D297394
MALHLMKDENEHIEVREIRGFVSDTVMGALNESYALSKATRCKQFMYSMSANPPPDKNITADDLVSMIDRAELRLGLTGQPRVIVIHEKEGRRHAHCVWSRIIVNEMKAVPMSHDHRVLTNLTRDIILERGWKLPDGLVDKRLRDPLSFNLAQWQQAKRIGKDPRAIKAALQDAWALSDSKPALINALQERGFKLAQGNKGRIVVIDHRLEVYALYKWSNQKTKAIKARVGDPSQLPTVDETKDRIRTEMRGTARRLQSDVENRSKAAQDKFEARRKALVTKQKTHREALKQQQAMQFQAANKIRQARFRAGISGVWDKLRGEHRRVRTQNEHEAYTQSRQHQQARDALVFRHLRERQQIEIFKLRHRDKAQGLTRQLEQDRRQYQHAASLHGPEP